PNNDYGPSFQAPSSYPGAGFGGGGESALLEETSDGLGESTSAPTPTLDPVIIVPKSPVITFPTLIQSANLNTYLLIETLTSTSVTFRGNASSTNIISTDFLSVITTIANQNNEWQLTLENLNQGTTTINFYASNQEQTATSSATTVDVFVDSEAPNVSLVVKECQDSISQSSCLLATASTTITANWESSESDLDYFILNTNGSTSTTTATTTQLTISGNQIYSLGVSAVDKKGNISQETVQIIELNNSPVVINEVAWAGTGSSNSDDEWIELYNKTDKEINLGNWTLYAEDETPYIPLSGTIPANGFFLLERTDDNTISDIPADLIYGNDASSWALNNSGGEHLLLSFNQNNATTTIDEILKSNYWNHNLYFSQQYNSIERYDPNKEGTDWGNWFPNDGSLIKNGLDADGNSLKGTPKSKNNINYFVSVTGSISSNKILTKENSPYLIGSYGLTVDNGVTLSIDPGVVVKMAPNSSVSLRVNGTLQSNGTSDNQVVFTTFSDDEFGGDLNGDGICDPNNASSTSVCPKIGDWKQILFEPTSQNSYLKNTIFRYGGHYVNGQVSKYKGMVTSDTSNLVVENSIFEYSKSKGLQLIGVSSQTLISNNIFRNNNYIDISPGYSPVGLLSSGGSPIIENNLFENNVIGLGLDNSTAVVTSNIFNDNLQYAISGSAGVNDFSNNSGSNNGYNSIPIAGILTELNKTMTLKKNALPYLVSENAIVIASSTLVIEPGVVIKFKDKKFEIQGQLDVNGEVGNTILFTSISDDSDGTNIQNDDQPDPILFGNHRGLYMKSGSVSEIKNAEFRYLKCGVSYENSPIHLENVVFKNNETAICFDGASATSTISNLIFEENIATSTNPL
ncbi:lamin tail domain-containing protein, partial [Patescibacteria group bacterium]|nr:lamin tail domain-containing protein [Patescibacteria group bacterium]